MYLESLRKAEIYIPRAYGIKICKPLRLGSAAEVICGLLIMWVSIVDYILHLSPSI